MIAVSLTALTLYLLCFHRLPPIAVFFVCLSSFVFYHPAKEGVLHTSDSLAQLSRLNQISPIQKLCFTLLCLFICLLSDKPFTGIFLFCILLFSGSFLGRIPIFHYIHYLALPTAFLMLSSLALLFSYYPYSTGVLAIPWFRGYLCMTASAQQHTLLLLVKSMGALSCLCFLSLSTPIHEIISVMHKLKLPNIFIDLMYLTYRCIFILFFMYDTMKHAATSRMGFATYSGSIKTLGSIYANLLTKSYRQALQMFDAMESRCYDRSITFLAIPSHIHYGYLTYMLAILAVSAFTMK